jgi:hypothetical protein
LVGNHGWLAIKVGSFKQDWKFQAAKVETSKQG